MNAATKTLRHGMFATSFVETPLWIKRHLLLFVLGLSIIISALGVVYVTNEVRDTYTQIQQQQQEYERLQVQKGKLLLEKGAWTSGARVKNIAAQYLVMQVPVMSDVILISQ